MKKILFAVLIFIAVLAVIFFAASVFFNKIYGGIKVVREDSELIVIEGGGGNSGIIATKDKKIIIIIDTKMPPFSRKLKELADGINKNASVMIINTHSHLDHTGGNGYFPNAKIVTGDDGPLSQNNNMIRIKKGREITVRADDENLIVKNIGRGHTDNDLIVYLQKRKILFSGDLVFNGMHPVLIKKTGTNTADWSMALRRIIKDHDVVKVIPGHGPSGAKELLERQLRYFMAVSDNINNRSKLNEIKKSYGHYSFVPGLSGFDATVKYIRKEKLNNTGAIK